MRIQNTVIVSVYGGVVQDIATDLDPDRVRFILVDHDDIEAGDPPDGRNVNPSKITDVFSLSNRQALGLAEPQWGRCPDCEGWVLTSEFGECHPGR